MNHSEIAKKFLKDWNWRSDKYYDKHKKIHKDFDINEREHYRNCINFWENRLNETQSP